MLLQVKLASATKVLPFDLANNTSSRYICCKPHACVPSNALNTFPEII